MRLTFACIAAAFAVSGALGQPFGDGEGRQWIPQIWPETLPQGVGPPPMPKAEVLSRAWGDAFVAGDNIRELSLLGVEEVAAAEHRRAERYALVNPGPLRVGLVRKLESPILAPGPELRVRNLDDGRKAWTLAVASTSAYYMRVHFRDLRLGASTLVLYAVRDGAVVSRGPFRGGGPNGDGEFWAPSLPGEITLIEIVGPDEPQFLIDEVVHEDRDLDANPEIVERGDCPGVCPCHLDVMCQGDPPVNTAARQATGRMNYISDGNSYVCTGTMLNDLDPDTFVPYFLTAAHCISTQSETNTLEVTWFYQSNNTPSNCSGSPAVPNRTSLPQSFGGVLLHDTGPPALTNDSCFIRLNPDHLPPGAAFAGATADQESGIAAIHHPAGSWKRAAFGHFESLSIDCGADCGCFDSAYYAFYDLDNGIIQGGSSGSGMFNASGQIIGQLFGHCTLCPDAEDCDHGGDWCLMYGEWENTWPDIEYWIRLGGTIWIDRAHTGTQSGLSNEPFRTILGGYNRAWNDTRLAIRPGSYPETITMVKRIRLIATNGTVRIGG